MSRLRKHLAHILSDVVPQRGAAQAGMEEAYIKEIEARLQPPHLVHGLELWNAGHFYEQHETLEWLWRATSEPVRDALKGIIQSGVGAYHVLRRNRRGALGKWTGAIGYLAPFESPYGIDVTHLRQQIMMAREALLEDEQDPPNWDMHLARIKALHIVFEPRLAHPHVTALLRRFDRAWQETVLSVKQNIHGLTEEEANWRPIVGERSIRDLLVHLGIRKAVIMNRCFGDQTLNMADINAPESWHQLLRWLTEQHEALHQPLGFLQDKQLSSKYPIFGQTLTIEQIIEANIEHDFYHASEINHIRQVIAGVKSQP